MTSLIRLFQREVETGSKFSLVVEAAMALDKGGSMPIDPWRVVVDCASRSKEELRSSSQWLCLLATSGVDIPVSTYLHFCSSAKALAVGLTDILSLVEAGMRSTWLKSLGRQQLQA